MYRNHLTSRHVYNGVTSKFSPYPRSSPNSSCDFSVSMLFLFPSECYQLPTKIKWKGGKITHTFILRNIYFCERNDSDFCWLLDSRWERTKSLDVNNENLILNHACSSVLPLKDHFPLKYNTHLGDQIRMSDDCTDKEPVVCHFCAHFHLGCPKIQVHLVIGTRNGSKIKISHPVQF